MTEWVKGEIIRIEKWTDKLFSIIINAPIDPFIAGQFTKLALDVDGQRIQRAYSYVNAPSSQNLEFYIVTVPIGKLSSTLTRVSLGAEIMLTKKSAGFFVLDEVPECETLWMLATGTAIGPYLSILQTGIGLERFKNLVLVHATRFTCDLSYLPLMTRLQEQYNGKLRIQTIVSREITSNALSGRIPTLLQNNHLEAAIGLTIHPDTSHIMLCGNPQMVSCTQKLLQEQRKMRKHFRRKPGHITSENYW
ncbi:ferredoxin--NADP(+) reductase [Candidatus Gillettellia adelgis]